jgi:hypothetical protein
LSVFSFGIAGKRVRSLRPPASNRSSGKKRFKLKHRSTGWNEAAILTGDAAGLRDRVGCFVLNTCSNPACDSKIRLVPQSVAESQGSMNFEFFALHLFNWHRVTAAEFICRLAIWGLLAIACTLAGLGIVRRVKSGRELEPPVG